MNWSVNRQIAAAGTATLLIMFVIRLTPWYDVYIAHDHRWTCAKLRKTIEWNYSGLLDESGSTYVAGTEELLRKAQEQTYRTLDVTIEPERSEDGYHHYAIPDLCRDGGTIHVVMDDAGWIQVTCDLEEHDVDYTDLPEF